MKLNNSNRRILIGSLLTAPVWTKPSINYVILPAHAQTSSAGPEVLGTWRFSRIDGGSPVSEFYLSDSIDITFLPNGELDVDHPEFVPGGYGWGYDDLCVDCEPGFIFIGLLGPKLPWIGYFTKVSNGIAEEIVIRRGFDFISEIRGVRVG